jgi:hypothetical protein
MLEEGGHRRVSGEHGGVVLGQTELRLPARALVGRQLRQRFAFSRDFLLRDRQRRKVGIGEVTVIHRLFLAAHGERLALVGVPQARLLRDFAAAGEHGLLPHDLVLERLSDEAKGVDVLQFHARPECFLSERTDRYVGVAAKGALFQVAVVHADEHQDLS